MAKEVILTYFHMDKGHLWDYDLVDDDELSDTAKDRLRGFGYEHEIEAEIDTETGEYKIIRLDGRNIDG